MPPRLNHAGRYVFQILRQHWLAALLFALGIALRAITMAAYHPALLYVDSLKYLYGAWPGSDPIGYEVPLKAVLLVGDLGLWLCCSTCSAWRWRPSCTSCSSARA